MKLLFSALFHEFPRSIGQVIHSTLQLYPDSYFVYGVDCRKVTRWTEVRQEARRLWHERRGYAVRPAWNIFLPSESGKVRRIERRREYSWKNLHRFIWDVIEQVPNGFDFDYLVFMDSDAFFTGGDLRHVLEKEGKDFTVSASGAGVYTDWVHGKTFASNWHEYEGICKAVGLVPGRHAVGTMFGLFVLSRKAVDALKRILPDLERDSHYLEFEETRPDHPGWEALVPHLLADMGLTWFNIRDYVAGYRVRPFWAVSEYREDIWFYHPVNRHPADAFRKLLLHYTGNRAPAGPR